MSIDVLGVRILPWHVLLFPLATVVIRFDWRAVPPLLTWTLVGFAFVAGISALLAVQSGADFTSTSRSAAMLLTDLVLVSLFVGCPACWLSTLRSGLFAGLLIALAGGTLEACGFYRFPGSADILGPDAIGAPLSVASWAESAPAFGFGNPNNYAVSQVALASLVITSRKAWLAVLPMIWFVVLKTDSDLALFCLVAISCLAVARASAQFVKTLGVIALFIVTIAGFGKEHSRLDAALEKWAEMVTRLGDVFAAEDPRVQLAIAAWHAWADDPVLGAGPGGSSRVIPAMIGKADIGYLTDLHNQLATAFVETGLVGGLALTLLLLYPFRVLTNPRGLTLAATRPATTVPYVVVVQCCTVAVMFCASNSLSVWPWWAMIGLMIRTTMPPLPMGALGKLAALQSSPA